MLRPGRHSGGGGLPTSHYEYGGGGQGGGEYNYQQQQYPSSSSYGGFGTSRGNATYKDKRRKNIFVEYAKDPVVLLACATALFFLLTMHYRGKLNWLLRETGETSHKSVLSLIGDLKKLNQKFERENQALKNTQAQRQKRMEQDQDRLKKENRQLQKERDELRVKYEGNPEKQIEEARLRAREDAWKKQVQLLQQATSRESRRAVLEKFGPGPHRVKVFVVFPDDADEEEYTFTLEMAPLSSTPHAVHIFLEQVYHHLWDDAYIYLNGPHILQIGPEQTFEEESHNGDDRAAALKPFRELQLDTLVFPEYSEDFPHSMWTVGFTGRPGGPDFYINKVDNSKLHGPGGQFQHDLDEFADPCFAKVVDGFGTLKKIFSVPTSEDPEWKWFYDDPIYIVAMEIIDLATPQNDGVVSQEEQLAVNQNQGNNTSHHHHRTEEKDSWDSSDSGDGVDHSQGSSDMTGPGASENTTYAQNGPVVEPETGHAETFESSPGIDSSSTRVDPVSTEGEKGGYAETGEDAKTSTKKHFHRKHKEKLQHPHLEHVVP